MSVSQGGHLPFVLRVMPSSRWTWTLEKIAALADNPLVMAENATSALRIVIEGSKSPETKSKPKPQKMPGFHEQLTSAEIAQVVRFIRNAWGNHAATITDREIGTLRSNIDTSQAFRLHANIVLSRRKSTRPTRKGAQQ